MPYFRQKFKINTPFLQNPVVVVVFLFVVFELALLTFKSKHNLDYLRLFAATSAP